MSNFTWPVDKREKGNRIRVHLLIRQFLRKEKTEFVKIKKKHNYDILTVGLNKSGNYSLLFINLH